MSEGHRKAVFKNNWKNKRKPRTLEERFGDEVLTDNTKIPKYEQCKDCMFRYSKSYKGETIDDHRKDWCEIFERPDVKPIEFYDGSAECEFYEKE